MHSAFMTMSAYPTLEDEALAGILEIPSSYISLHTIPTSSSCNISIYRPPEHSRTYLDFQTTPPPHRRQNAAIKTSPPLCRASPFLAHSDTSDSANSLTLRQHSSTNSANLIISSTLSPHRLFALPLDTLPTAHLKTTPTRAPPLPSSSPTSHDTTRYHLPSTFTTRTRHQSHFICRVPLRSDRLETLHCSYLVEGFAASLPHLSHTLSLTCATAF